jgi:hypothetical protein
MKNMTRKAGITVGDENEKDEEKWRNKMEEEERVIEHL